MKKWHIALSLCLSIAYPLLCENAQLPFIKKTLEFDAIYDEFIGLYQKFGNQQYMLDEPITQKDHILQAAYIANTVGAPEEVVVGLLLHDVGQIAHERYAGSTQFLHKTHAALGAHWLQERDFPRAVWEWVGYHALAKVVLCMEYKNYYDHLSRASQESYVIQKKNYEENTDDIDYIGEFKANKRADTYRAQRMCDDMAKITALSVSNKTLPDFETYRDMTQRVWQGKGKPARDEQWQEHIRGLHLLMRTSRNRFEKLLTTISPKMVHYFMEKIGCCLKILPVH